MSLARLALRVSAVEAIKGQTLVGNNVLDSEIGAISISSNGSMRTEKERPFVAVYTDKSKSDLSDAGVREIFENGTCDLMFEVGVTAAMTETNKDTGVTELVGVGIPDTDRVREYFLDMTSRQIGSALTDPDNEWAEIFRGFVTKFNSVDKVRAGNTEGVRFAAHQIKINCAMICDPVRGDDIEDTPFADFLAKLEASEMSDYLKYAEDIRAELSGSDEDWKLLQRRLGLRADELRALGRGPIPEDVARETPEHTASTIKIEGAGTTETP